MKKAQKFSIAVFPAGAGDIVTLYPVRRFMVIGGKAFAIREAMKQYRQDNAGNVVVPTSLTLDYSVTEVNAEVGDTV